MLIAGRAAGNKASQSCSTQSGPAPPGSVPRARYASCGSCRLPSCAEPGEIGALVGAGEVRGVEATGSEDPLAVATAAHQAFGVTTAVTGPVDVIVGTDRTLHVANGHPLLARITGSGCMASAAIGIFLTAGDDPALQAALALGTYGLAAERAAVGAGGPGTFRARLLDEVACLHEMGVEGLNISAA